jgi:hypothetical protein
MSGDEEAKKHVDALKKYATQVAEGLIPVDSAPTFARPQSRDALDERSLRASEEAHERIEKLVLHQRQVDAGLIPEDSPPLFTLPQPLDDGTTGLGRGAKEVPIGTRALRG